MEHRRLTLPVVNYRAELGTGVRPGTNSDLYRWLTVIFSGEELLMRSTLVDLRGIALKVPSIIAMQCIGIDPRGIGTKDEEETKGNDPNKKERPAVV